jgi:hypothetical protein
VRFLVNRAGHHAQHVGASEEHSRTTAGEVLDLVDDMAGLTVFQPLRGLIDLVGHLPRRQRRGAGLSALIGHLGDLVPQCVAGSESWASARAGRVVYLNGNPRG